jgi:hypothetical protein
MAELHPAPVPKLNLRAGFFAWSCCAMRQPPVGLHFNCQQCGAGVRERAAGDTLYSVKRTIETGRLAVVSDNGEPGLRLI